MIQENTVGRLSINRPALRYYGGGWARAQWTTSFFPIHDIYVEPCFGAGSILFNKSMAKLETVNDSDGRVTNFFAVLRSVPDKLIAQISLTPWSEEEFEDCLQPSLDELEDARRFHFSCWASIRGGPNASGSDFRWQKRVTRRSSAVLDVATLDHLYSAAARLKNVQILSRDALEIIEKFLNEDSLIYFDPPFPRCVRRNRRGYRYEVTDEWHQDAAALLRLAKGPVVVASYTSEMYRVLYEEHGWLRVERNARTNSGGRAVDSLWLSPVTQERLAQNGR